MDREHVKGAADKVKGAIKDKSATAFLTLRWTFPAKRACVATDTEPDPARSGFW